MSNVSQVTQENGQISVFVNGVERQIAPGLTVAALLGSLGIEQGRVAVERNGLIVKRETWGVTGIQPGDQLEIVHFVGGGSR